MILNRADNAWKGSLKKKECLDDEGNKSEVPRNSRKFILVVRVVSDMTGNWCSYYYINLLFYKQGCLMLIFILHFKVGKFGFV